MWGPVPGGDCSLRSLPRNNSRPAERQPQPATRRLGRRSEQNRTERAIGARNRHSNLPADRRDILPGHLKNSETYGKRNYGLRKFCDGCGTAQEYIHSRPLSQKTGKIFDFIFKAKVSKRLQLLVGNARKFSRHPDSQRFAGYWVFIDCQPAFDLQIPAGVVDRLETADDFPGFFSMASVSTGKEPAVWRNPSRLTFVMLWNGSIRS